MPAWLTLIPLSLLVALFAVHLASPSARRWVWKVLAVQGLLMLISGAYLGLVWAPTEMMMGDVYRIIYAHVPLVWAALLGLGINAIGSIVYLAHKGWLTDCLCEASAEVGVLFGSLGVLLGAIWAKPTWGVWWTWDPRLTSAATMLIIGAGYLTLRRFIDDPDKRATWSAVVGIFSGVDLLLVWYSVKVWNSLHQVQSTQQTVDPNILRPMYWNAVGFLCLAFVFIWHRFVLARETRAREVALPSALPGGLPSTASVGGSR